VNDDKPIFEDSSLQEYIRTIRLVVFDFDGVFTDNMVHVLEDGSEAVRCFRGDGIGLQKLKRVGIETIIISTEANPVVSVRSDKLGIRCLQGCADKRAALEGVVLAEVAFVGNDVNDLPCLTSVGLPIVVRDAHADVVLHARYQTKTRGGYGAVREVCDLFERTVTSE
jgi:YrbI family 3-deoxy-D-manno-octulosonate 8-phosphate phosphatase